MGCQGGYSQRGVSPEALQYKTTNNTQCRPRYKRGQLEDTAVGHPVPQHLSAREGASPTGVCCGKKPARQHLEAKPFPSGTLLQGPLLHEASVPTEKKKIFKGTRSVSTERAKRLNLELRGKKSITSTLYEAKAEINEKRNRKFSNYSWTFKCPSLGN